MQSAEKGVDYVEGLVNGVVVRKRKKSHIKRLEPVAVVKELHCVEHVARALLPRPLQEMVIYVS